jgi:hypothetical protein
MYIIYIQYSYSLNTTKIKGCTLTTTTCFGPYFGPSSGCSWSILRGDYTTFCFCRVQTILYINNIHILYCTLCAYASRGRSATSLSMNVSCSCLTSTRSTELCDVLDSGGSYRLLEKSTITK